MMSMPWRLMGNLEVIKRDVKAHYHPSPLVYTIGDARHQKVVSDHNPADYGFGLVVAAIDVMFPPSKISIARGNRLVDACIHRTDLSYVIFNGRIWSAVRAWKPIAYHGANPHRDHVHISSKHSLAADLNRAHLIFTHKED